MEEIKWKLDAKNTDDYLELCQQAVDNDEVFANFRRMSPMNMIVENSPMKSGEEYYHCIEMQYPWLFAYYNDFMKSDSIGSPIKYPIRALEISPTTLRYIKTVGDLRKFFGWFDGMRIAEIGGGYGGLCKIIHDVFKPSKYTIYDLPVVQSLQEKFLRNFDIPCCFSDLQCETPPLDLLIAMYSWSELSHDLQNEYLTNVISKAIRSMRLITGL
jgi:putative sugar O-methyltransferase